MSNEIPKNVENILTDDEEIEEIYYLKEYEVYATNKRIIERRKRRIRDFDYNHVSSISYESKRYWWIVLLGVLVVIVGILFRAFTDSAFFWWVVVIGLAFAVGAAFVRTEWVEINIVGLNDSIHYRGDKEELDSLLYIVRKNRTSESMLRKEDDKDIGDVVIIRQLAELRDKGILTEEEFEEKKRKILQDSD